MNGYDGQYFKLVVREMSVWSEPGLGLPHNPFQGMGALSLINSKLLPSYFFLSNFRESRGVVWAYVVTSLEIFLATLLFGRVLGHSLKVSLAGAWILTLCSLPFFEFAQIYPISNIAPSIVEGIAANTAGIALFGLALRGSVIRRLFAASGLAALVVWSLATRHIAVVLIAPAALAISLGMLLAVPKTDGRVGRAIVALIPLTLVLAAGGGIYFLGIMLNNASAMFSSELNQAVPRAAYNISIAFQSGTHGLMGPVLVALAALGLVINLARIEYRDRAKIAVLAVLTLFAISGLFFATSGAWVYPLPVYFEFALWPFYAIYAAEALTLLSRLLPVIDRFPRRSLLGALVITTGVGLHFQPMISRGDVFDHPPIANQFTNIMSSNIALKSPGPFRGYAATFAGYGGADGPKADWFTLVVHDGKVVKEIGNSMRMIGLWYFDIPTLEEYQPLTSPALYAVTSRLLSRPRDHQTRSVLTLTKPNLPLLQSMGVRYVIADDMLSTPAVEQATKAVFGELQLRLYELPEANLGDYSPTEPVIVSTAAEALAEMSRIDFDFHRRVVLFAGIKAPLVPVSRAHLDVIVGGYQLKAESTGPTILLLPLQYSHCMEIETLGGDAPKLLRANLSQAALLFDKVTNIRLRTRTDIFRNSWCSFDDAREELQFGIKEIGRTPEHDQPRS